MSTTKKQKTNNPGAEAAGTIAGATPVGTTAGTGGAAGRRPPRPLSVRERLVRGEVTADCPATACGEDSELVVVEAVSIASGRDLLGLGAVAQENVLLLTWWGSVPRMIRTVAERHGISGDSLQDTLLVLDPEGSRGRGLSSHTRGGRSEPGLSLEATKRLCVQRDIKVVIVCGLQATPGAGGCTATGFLFALLRKLARETNAAVWLIDDSPATPHHTHHVTFAETELRASALAPHTCHSAGEIAWSSSALAAAWDIYSARTRVAEGWEPAPLCRSHREAAARGDHAYFTGKPCTHGHVSARYTKSHDCSACVRDQVDRRLTTALQLTARAIGFEIDRGTAGEYTAELLNYAQYTLSGLQKLHKEASSGRAAPEPEPARKPPVLTLVPLYRAIH